MAVNPNSQVFLFLSQILGRKVVDPESRVLGRVSDLAAIMADFYPQVTGLLFLPRGQKEPRRVAWGK
ncbi:MAG TPA: hypothetical protein VLS90_18200, partial [Thermodesulfobacteriota bacterium]|nr:hypothetical protein [Thermodesulfobacteriota bacterium]